jgi:hypothetical protein
MSGTARQDRLLIYGNEEALSPACPDPPMRSQIQGLAHGHAQTLDRFHTFDT